jgi:hypothetical protein
MLLKDFALGVFNIRVGVAVAAAAAAAAVFPYVILRTRQIYIKDLVQ